MTLLTEACLALVLRVALRLSEYRAIPYWHVPYFKSGLADFQTYDGRHRAPAIGVGCDAAEEVKKVLWLVLRVNELYFVGNALFLKDDLAPLSIRAAAGHVS